MDIKIYLAFLVVSFGVIVVPGPNVLVIISTSIAHGSRRGLQTVAGTSLAMAVQLVIVAIGTVWIVKLISNGLYYLKWGGVIYLLCLGVYHLKTAICCGKQKLEISASSTFTRGFLVSLSNPKTLLFFSAFLPQFVSGTADYNLQILLLSMSFLVMAMVLDSCYAMLSSRLTLLIKSQYLNSIQNGFSGLLFLSASAWLAVTNRSS